jgi:hypothetical protein
MTRVTDFRCVNEDGNEVLCDAFGDGSQERHPAIATGLTILDATDAN